MASSLGLTVEKPEVKQSNVGVKERMRVMYVHLMFDNV